MKNAFIIISLVISFIHVCRAQAPESRETQSACLEDGIIFMNQQDIDNFRAAVGDCDVIVGHVEIFGDSITNLNGLQGIKRMLGGLHIHDAGQLTSLAGLDSLDYIKKLEMSSTPLTSLSGLGKVNTVWSEMEIHDMPVLTSVAGFGEYPCVVGSLYIKDNDSLLNLDGFINLTQTGTIEIEDNNALTSITGLSNITSAFYGHLNILGNSSLSLCNAPLICNFLSVANGYIRIYGNAQGCDRPASIATSCGFTMPCLKYGMYILTTQVAVDSFAIDYPGCKDLKGNLFIEGPDIVNLTGLLGITSDSGMVRIGGTSITNLHGLDSLKSVFYHLSIGEDFSDGNDSLTSLIGLENLETVGIRLDIKGNSKLVNFEGLSKVRKVGILDVEYNESLTSFDGLNQLDTITKYLEIWYNESLADISSLISVRSITEALTVSNNIALSSLYGLDNMVPSGDMRMLDITDNPLISECDLASVCSMLQVADFVSIENNAPGCSSVEEVEEACTVGVNDLMIDKLRLYPNPARDYIIISFGQISANSQISANNPMKANNQMSSTIQMTIYNASGMQVMKSAITDTTEWINISTLPKGMYLMHIAGDAGISVGKFLKE